MSEEQVLVHYKANQLGDHMPAVGADEAVGQGKAVGQKEEQDRKSRWGTSTQAATVEGGG